jgi:hypothetical protein
MSADLLTANSLCVHLRNLRINSRIPSREKPSGQQTHNPLSRRVARHVAIGAAERTRLASIGGRPRPKQTAEG